MNATTFLAIIVICTLAGLAAAALVGLSNKRRDRKRDTDFQDAQATRQANRPPERPTTASRAHRRAQDTRNDDIDEPDVLTPVMAAGAVHAALAGSHAGDAEQGSAPASAETPVHTVPVDEALERAGLTGDGAGNEAETAREENPADHRDDLGNSHGNDDSAWSDDGGDWGGDGGDGGY